MYKRLFFLFIASFFLLSNIQAQSEYKKWVKEEKKDKTYSKREVKRATKEYAELIYENSKEVFKWREDFMDKSPKKRDKAIKDEFALRIRAFRAARFKVENKSMPSLEDQAMEEIRMAWDFDGDYFPRNIEGQSKCVSKNYDMAVSKGLELAKVNLGNEIAREIGLQFAKKDFVKKFGLEKSQDMMQAILDTKDIMVENIGDVNKVMEITNSKNITSVEVIVRIFYSGNMAKSNFQSALREVLKDDTALYNEMISFLNEPTKKKK